MPPNIVVEDFGVVRTDAGMLRTGVYFTDSVKYVTHSVQDTSIYIVFLDVLHELCVQVSWCCT